MATELEMLDAQRHSALTLLEILSKTKPVADNLNVFLNSDPAMSKLTKKVVQNVNEMLVGALETLVTEHAELNNRFITASKQ